MHYFSRIVLHRSALTFQELAELGFGIQTHHRLVWRAFGDRANRERDFIFRVDVRDDAIVIWTLSARVPGDWGGKFVVETKPWSPRLEPGQRLGFDLRVNPTVSSRVPGKRGKRHDAVMHHKFGLDPVVRRDTPESDLVHDATTAWLESQGARLGFAISADSVRADSYTQHAFKKKPTSNNLVRLSTVELAGILTVEDPNAFGLALTRGVGSAKAYGLGLLLIRPLGS